MADREGRLEKRPLRIKAEIFPYDSLDINGELTVLERSGFIQSYVHEDKEYLFVVNFKSHQSPHHTEAPSKIPDISEGCILTVNPPLDLREYPSDSLIPDSLIPDSLIQVQPVKKPSKPAKEKTVEEWLGEIKRNSAYIGIDIDREYNKMLAWCNLKKKAPSKARFLNWLNNAEVPVIAKTPDKEEYTKEELKQMHPWMIF